MARGRSQPCAVQKGVRQRVSELMTNESTGDEGGRDKKIVFTMR